MFRVLARNIAANWMGFAVQVAVTFFLTPFVLGKLGDARYGVWVVSTSIVGYYGLLELGLRAGTTQYLTRYFSTKQFSKMNMTASSVFVMLSSIGAFVCVLSAVLGLLAPRWFHLPAGVETEVFWCVLIVGGSAAVQCALFPFAAVFTATQRYDLSNLIGIVTRILSAIAVWLCLSWGYGLVGLTLATAGGNLVDYSLRWIVAYRLIPELRVSPRLACWESLKEVFSFAVWSFLIAVNTAIVLHTDILVIGFFLPISSIAIYALANNIVRYLTDVLGVSQQVLYPAATQFHSENNLPGLRWLLFAGSRLLFLIGIILAVIGGVWAEDFYRLWVGYDSVGVDGVKSAGLLFRLLSARVVLEAMAGAPGQILIGSGRVKMLAIVIFCLGILKVALSLILIQPWGLVGVAIGTLVASVIHTQVLIPWLTCRQLSVSLRSFFLQVCPRPLAVGVLLAAASISIREFHPPNNWFQLVAQGTVAVMVGMLLTLLLGIRASERNRIVSWCLGVLAKSRGWKRFADQQVDEVQAPVMASRIAGD